MPEAPLDVLLTVMPFSGHVFPFVRAAAAFTAAGHTVRVYTGSAHAEAFRGTGAEVVPWRRAPDFDERAIAVTFPQAGRPGPLGLLANVEHVFIRSSRGQLEDLLAEWARRPWDVVVADSLSVGGLLAAERLGSPSATLSVVPLSMASRELPPPLVPIPRARGPLGRLRDRVLWMLVGVVSTGLRHAYRDARRDAGLDPRAVRYTEAFHSSSLVMALGIPELEEPRSDLPAQVHFVGAFGAPGGRALPRWWAEATSTGLPLVHVTQGTFDTDPDDLLRPSLDTLAGRLVTVIAATGRTGDDALPFPSPENAFVADLVSYADLLPRISLMITNGGWGGVLAALAHGVPLIVAGGDLDKPMIAAAVARSGAGIDLRTGRPRTAAVARALDRMEADTSYRAAALRLAARFAEHDPGAEVVSLVERLVATGAPVLRSGDPWA